MRGGRRVCYWRGMGVGKYTNDLGGTGRSLSVIYFGPTMTEGGGDFDRRVGEREETVSFVMFGK